MEKITLSDFVQMMAKRAAEGSCSNIGTTGPRNEVSKNQASSKDETLKEQAWLANPSSSKYADIAVVVALHVELTQLKRFPGISWSTVPRCGIQFHVGRSRFCGKDVTIVAAMQTEMGTVPAAMLSSQIVRIWHPKLLTMTGICAGVRGEVELGDVIVAQHLFDYESGLLTDGKLTPEYHTVSMDEELSSYLLSFAENRDLCRTIKDSWMSETGKPNRELTAHVGTLASGPSVLEDKNKIAHIQQNMRRVLGVDMEAYAVARAAQLIKYPTVPFLIVKGVQDFGESPRDKTYREYAAFASSNFLFRSLEQYWTQIEARPRVENEEECPFYCNRDCTRLPFKSDDGRDWNV